MKTGFGTGDEVPCAIYTHDELSPPELAFEDQLEENPCNKSRFTYL